MIQSLSVSKSYYFHSLDCHEISVAASEERGGKIVTHRNTEAAAIVYPH